MNDPLLTVKAVAEFLEIERHTVLALIKKGDLVASDISLQRGIGRARWRIRESDLKAFIEATKHKPAKRRPRRRKSKPARRFF